MHRLSDKIRFQSHIRLTVLAGLFVVLAWRLFGSIPQPYVDQEQLARLKAGQAAVKAAD